MALLVCVSNYNKKNAKVIVTITCFQDDIFCSYVNEYTKIMNIPEDGKSSGIYPFYLKMKSDKSEGIYTALFLS